MFGWLFGKEKEKPNFTVSKPYAADRDIVCGVFEYQNIVKCNVLKIEFIVNARVTDSETIPETKCQCGTKIKLMNAPIVFTRVFDGKEMTSTRNQLLRLDLDHRHSIKLGKTLHYEVSA